MHSVVFAGFSPEALAGRIEDGHSKIVVTADEGVRAGRAVALKNNVDEALQLCTGTQVENVVVLKHTGAEINWVAGRDHCYQTLTDQQPIACSPEEMSAEDPLFIVSVR